MTYNHRGAGSMDMKDLTEWERGWLAGLIDGEGCIILAKTKRPRGIRGRGYQWSPCLSIANTNRAIIETAKVLAGGSIQTARRKNHRTIFSLVITSNGIRSVFSKIQLIAKEAQRSLILEACSLLSQHDSWNTPNDVRLEEIRKEISRRNSGV